LPLAELAAYFRTTTRLPGEELARLALAARAAGSRWEAIASACHVSTYKDLAGVIYRITGESGAELLYSATQDAIRELSGTENYHPPLTWTCQPCGQQVTDCAPAGRPVHVEHGHGPGCARLARDQAAEDQRRRAHLPGLILNSEPPVGPVQRHWLREPVTDDCPHCGWHGYFHHYIATIDGDWANAVCDDCHADLHPDITVTVTFNAARAPRSLPRGGEAVAVIRQRDRSDHDYPGIGHFPDLGQQMTWHLWWEHASMLVEEARASCDNDLARISRDQAESITAELAAPHWPPDAARHPGSPAPIRSKRATCQDLLSGGLDSVNVRPNGPTCMSISRVCRVAG
jgi:hypothetical protein